jgi:poly-D-alanine transfer protein DltD
VPGSPIIGGHAVVLQQVAAPGQLDMLHVVTWGHLQKMNLEFFHHYFEEAWVVLSPEWFNSSGVDTDGFNMTQLQADFSQMTA